MKANLPVWRSLLYVPANVEKYVDKAHTRGADCIQVDLEDSVPVAEKDQARTLGQGVAARGPRSWCGASPRACGEAAPAWSCASIDPCRWRCAISRRRSVRTWMASR